MLCRVLRLKHVPIINRINPLLCLLIHFPYEFKPSCFLGHLNHKIPSGFSKHAIWNFSVFTRTVWPSGRAHTLSLFIFLSSLSFCWLFHKPCFPSQALSILSLTHTHTLHLVTRTSASAFYTYIMHQSKTKRKRDEIRNLAEIEHPLTYSFSISLRSVQSCEIKIDPIYFLNKCSYSYCACYCNNVITCSAFKRLSFSDNYPKLYDSFWLLL